MPTIEMPNSRFLQISDWKKVKKLAKTPKENVAVIREPPIEAKGNSEMLEVEVYNEIIGDKTIYDFKNKFSDFFEQFGNNTDAWIGKMLVPIIPDKASNFFVRYEVQTALEENIGK